MGNIELTKSIRFMNVYLLICLLVILTTGVFAQETGNTEKFKFTDERTRMLEELSGLSPMTEDPYWFVGKEYRFFYTGTTGTPFFMDETNIKGSLVFNGKKYSDQILFLDLVLENLVLNRDFKDKSSVYVSLNNAWIEEFSLEINGGNYRFLPVSYFSYVENKLPDGFLEVVYYNDLKLLFKHSKELHFEAIVNDNFKYKLKTIMYLVKDNKSFEITRRSELLSLFPENKKQIRSFLREYGIIYKNAIRHELKLLIGFCEGLN